MQNNTLKALAEEMITKGYGYGLDTEEGRLQFDKGVELLNTLAKLQEQNSTPKQEKFDKNLDRGVKVCGMVSAIAASVGLGKIIDRLLSRKTLGLIAQFELNDRFTTTPTKELAKQICKF